MALSLSLSWSFPVSVSVSVFGSVSLCLGRMKQTCIDECPLIVLQGDIMEVWIEKSVPAKVDAERVHDIGEGRPVASGEVECEQLH